MKLRNFDIGIHWNTLIFFYKKDMTSDLKISHEKMPSFAFFFIVWVHFSHSTEKFRFWKSLNHFFCFLLFKLKKVMSDLNRSCKQCLIWFKCCCLSRILAISWEIWTLNFKESVVRSKYVPFFFLFLFFAITIEKISNQKSF